MKKKVIENTQKNAENIQNKLQRHSTKINSKTKWLFMPKLEKIVESSGRI